MPSVDDLDDLDLYPLAFSTAQRKLVEATGRMALVPDDRSVVLNVEIFENDTDHNSPILLLTHGICASAETKGIQAIVAAARKNRVKVAVIELEGHGYSTSVSGKKMVCGKFERHLDNMLQFVNEIVPALRGEIGNTPYYLAGNSFGGLLCLYASDYISKNRGDFPSNFQGVAAIAPAVAVNEAQVPSDGAMMGLSFLSFIAPSMTLSVTPMEDPSSYSCPKQTKRNYKGNWPLSTAKMLVDLTTRQVKRDVESGELNLKGTENCLIFGGIVDKVVPIEIVRKFYDSICPKRKMFVQIGKGHDMLFHKTSADEIVVNLFKWILEDEYYAVDKSDFQCESTDAKNESNKYDSIN